MHNNVLKRLLFIILFEIAACKNGSILYLTLPNQETFSFQCQDQMVKVNSSIYHLDRLRASLKSNYFEKLFTSDDFEQKNEKVLEIQPTHGEVFSSVVDLIHGKKLIDVLNKDNYFQLLETMDYLEMEIDLEIFSSFIDDHLKLHSYQVVKIFELYNFIKNNSKFKHLLTSIFKCLSSNLTILHDREMLSYLTLDHLIGIIKLVENVTDEERCKIVQTCTKWLCRHSENRLAHMETLMNSIKPIFHAEEKDTNNIGSAICLPKSDVDEQVEEKIIAKCMLAVLSPRGPTTPIYLKPRYAAPLTIANANNEYIKLRKFLETGDLYDITVRVGEKAYKLHRAVLESRCGHFADIFRAEYAEAVAKYDGNATCPCREKEYLLDAVNQSAFDAMISYMYLDEDIGKEFSGFGRIFKIADHLKIDNVFETAKDQLINYNQEVSPLDVVEVLNCVYGKTQYDDLYGVYLSKHISTQWPEIYNMSQFCSISWPVLQNVLKSPYLRFDDPHKILDFCSIWIIHDVQNRYQFLPRIARIINPNCLIDQDTNKTENVENFNDRSQQQVRNELWKILSTIPYNIDSSNDLSNSTPKKLSEEPVFVTSRNGKTIRIWNVDLEVITSLSGPELNESYRNDYRCIDSATMIGDNLFIFFSFRFSHHMLFVYNFSLKKRFPLSMDINKAKGFMKDLAQYTLLNRNNEIYCCSTKGIVMKFSLELNRWTFISKNESNENYPLFTSDGENLYRMYKASKAGQLWSFVVEPFDFEKSAWSSASSLPLLTNISTPEQLSVVNGRDLVVITNSEMILFDSKSKTWRYRELPLELRGGAYFSFPQYEDKMFFLVFDKLYVFSLSNGISELKKEMLSRDMIKYERIIIHRPKQFCNTDLQCLS